MSKFCFGVDVGGTTVKLGLFGTEGNLLDKWEIKTRSGEGGKLILPDIAASILGKMEERNIAREDIVGVGVGVPGPVDGEGTIYNAVNLGWGIFNVKKELQALVNLPVEIGNDANVAALGEMWQGGARGYANVVLATLGTGVGGGIIVEGKILSGSTGAAGEIGHIHVEDDETEACGCGNVGCLEQYASATGVVRLANRKLAASDMDSSLRGIEVTAKDVWDAVKAGDALAIEVADQFGWYLGRALANIANVVNPEIFVLGGGVSKAGEVLIEYIQKYYKTYAFPAAKGVLFGLAKLGNDAGIYGSAKMVLND